MSFGTVNCSNGNHRANSSGGLNMRVAINGIGVAGPALAYWLREFGHEPVLFEKAPALRTGGYLIDFWGLGYEIAERMGLSLAKILSGH